MPLSERMKYLAMRAKKMTAKMKDVPEAEYFKVRFGQLDTEISADEATQLRELVIEHRKGPAPRAEKPEAKVEVSAAPMKRSASHGRI